jgi:DNA-binding NarL/FixJ family response regulator
VADRPITVVVCDDVPDMRLLVKLSLEEDVDIEVVGEAADGKMAIDVIEKLQPDVVVLDLSMPNFDGLEAIPVIHDVAPKTEIVVFSGFEESKVAEVALRTKASKFVQKGAPFSVLTAAVRSLAPG